MSNFGLYAKYYDLLYADKNYGTEIAYIDGLIRKFAGAGAFKLLNLGCGTGKHDFLLLDQGYSVTGVDLSAEMIDEANKTLQNHPAKARAKFVQGDVRTFKNNELYDVVVSLFHVASYQAKNSDVLQMFATAANHLKEEGIFIFDCWYGPAVLTARPEVRIKRMQNEEINITRLAEPVLYANENLVDVNYTVLIDNKIDKGTQTISEKHTMRYFFKPEILSFLQQSGFQLLACEEWLTAKEPGFESWNVVFVCKKMSNA